MFVDLTLKQTNQKQFALCVIGRMLCSAQENDVEISL